MQACISPLHRTGCLSSTWSTCSNERLQVEPSPAANSVQNTGRTTVGRTPLKCNGFLGRATPYRTYQAMNAISCSIVRKSQQAGRRIPELITRKVSDRKQGIGASQLKVQGKRRTSVCRSSLQQVAPLYEIAAGGETINPWSLIGLAVGTAALAFLSGLVFGGDEDEEMDGTMSEQTEKDEPEPPTEPIRKRNRPVRREP